MNETTWIAVAFSGVSMIGTVAAGLFAFLTTRTNREYDVELQTLKQSAEACARDRAEMKAELAKCSEHHQQSERDRAEMRGKLTIMESLLTKTVSKQAELIQAENQRSDK
jgi:hypothetical protein